ncbi:hypothetical protein JHK85_028154 [Glycine max]|nr:hypothetical protein JHK85_028154 [Glycine max]
MTGLGKRCIRASHLLSPPKGGKELGWNASQRAPRLTLSSKLEGSPPLGTALSKQHSSNFVFIQHSHQLVSRHRVSR